MPDQAGGGGGKIKLTQICRKSHQTIHANSPKMLIPEKHVTLAVYLKKDSAELQAHLKQLQPGILDC